MAEIKKGGMTFQSKEKLRNYVKYVLNNQDLDKMLEGKWLLVVDDVLKGHQDYKQKVGKGTYQIGVTTCPVNPKNKHFYILREDGSSTDFSYLKALTTPSHATDMKKALRATVKVQTMVYKEKYFNENAVGKYCRCPETGLKITLKTSHLDHYPVQFDEIVSDWLKLNKLKAKDVELEPTKDNEVNTYLVDKELEKSFHDYHLKVAQYRVVLDAVNRQRERAKGLKF